MISEDDRQRWALSAVRREGSMVSLSREAGVSELTLHRWWDLFLEGGRKRLRGVRSPEREEIESLKKEVAQRGQVIGEQTIAIRVLKKLGVPGSVLVPARLAGIFASFFVRVPGVLQPGLPHRALQLTITRFL